MKKYIKPKSVTWWSGILLIGAGALEAYQTNNLTTIYTNPHVLEGLGLIGLRGAVGQVSGQ